MSTFSIKEFECFVKDLKEEAENVPAPKKITFI
jgi:hypothetical protein